MTGGYGDYTGTAHPWLAALPSHWDLIPAKAIFAERREPSHSDDVHLTPSQRYGVLPQDEYMAVTGNKVVLNLSGAENMKHVEPRDFVIHLRSFQGGIEYSRYRGKVSMAYTVLRPHADVCDDYYRWLLKSGGYVQELRTTTNQLRDGQSIKFSQFARIPLPVPPLGEQRVIADYLDRETAKIDALIGKQEQLIEVLRERRRSVRDAASTAPGEMVRLRYLFTPSDDVNAPHEEVLSVYREWGVIPKSSRDDNFNKTPENLDRYLVVRPGDLVVNRMKAWQGSLGVSQCPGIVSPDYEVLRPTEGRLVPAFAHHLLRSPRLVGEYGPRSTGIRPSQWRLYWDQMAEIRIPIPPLDEQRRIAAYLDEQTAEIDALIEKTQRFIELAKERRAALITAAVTGQIDVRADADDAVDAVEGVA